MEEVDGNTKGGRPALRNNPEEIQCLIHYIRPTFMY